MGRMGYNRYTQQDIDDIARSVVRIIKSNMPKGADFSVLDNWVTACSNLKTNVKVFYNKTDEPGYYDPASNTVYLHHELDEYVAIRIICHELAHHVQVIMPFMLASQTRLERYDDEKNSVQHRVARRVEEIILGD
jgi:hypothetical protein